MAFVTKEKLFSKEFFITYSYLILGCFVFALGMVMFAEPYKFAPGGTYGLSIVLHHMFGWETEYYALCMDIPLLILGIWILGPRFGVKTVICTFAIPAFANLLHRFYGYEPLVENDALLSAIFGGIVYGIAIGLIFKSRATSGGSDIIAMILNKYTRISLGTLVIIVDSIITLTTVAGFQDWKLPMYSVIIVFIEGKVIDLIVGGPGINKTMYIISEKCDEIREKIINDMKRGGTVFAGTGMYQGKEKKMIYTVVTRREMTILTNFIAKVDPQAFVNVVDSNEILGEGFKSLNEED
ncbi:MAG: YitT family protein [Marinifilaceae bacterium]